MLPTNVLVIMSDQHSRAVAGCYGDPVVHTPHLDALAARGTRFTSAYCPVPICVPARASFATGRYAHQIGAWDNAAPYTGAEAASWGHRLTEQGHRVTTIGKLHHRRVEDPLGFPDQRLPMHVLDGVGDLYGSLRGDMPVRPESRQHVLEAGVGEAPYIGYDRAIADEAAGWLREAGRAREDGQPWALFVSFATPHFPLIVPEEYFSRYPLDSVPLPVAWTPEEWTHHPMLERQRRMQALDEPFDEATVRNAIAAYYGLVTFLDEQIGRVLAALDEAGLREDTRIIYTSDHGEMLGAHGLWWKSTLYEGAAAVPLILAGPGVPKGRVVATNATLLDCFPTIVEATGARLAPEDADLPGRSLWTLAREPEQPRVILSEYHAIFSPSGSFMLRNERYKYVYYVGYPPQLFDLIDDPDELRDLAGDPRHAAALVSCERQLRAIVDPEAVDRLAKEDQRRRIEAAGGTASVLAGGVKIPFTPAPTVVPSAERRGAGKVDG